MNDSAYKQAALHNKIIRKNNGKLLAIQKRG